MSAFPKSQIHTLQSGFPKSQQLDFLIGRSSQHSGRGDAIRGYRHFGNPNHEARGGVLTFRKPYIERVY